jgi:hypothetical protein
MDVDPIFCEITIRRLEHYRKTGLLGWQAGHPFEGIVDIDEALGQAATDRQLEVAQGTLF